MQALDDSFLQATGLGDLPEDARNELKNMLLERLEIQVGKRLTDQMSEQQLDEFETMMPAPSDNPQEQVRKEQAAYSWLEKNFPNYRQVVAEEIEKLRVEVSKDANLIRQSVQNPGSTNPASTPGISE
jgi:hypothetical protein